MRCEELQTTTGTAPGTDIPYSDHEAVMATLHVQRTGQAAGVTPSTAGKEGGTPPAPPFFWGILVNNRPDESLVQDGEEILGMPPLPSASPFGEGAGGGAQGWGKKRVGRGVPLH